MDLSKLRKLSQTTTPRNDVEAPVSHDGPDRPRRSHEDPEEVPLALAAMDVFISVGIGLLFIFLGLDYGKYLMKSGDVFPMPTPVTETGYTWKDGTPKAGQPVLPEELQEPGKTEYQQRLNGYQQGIVARDLNIVSQSSLFFFGVASIAAGLVAIVSHISAIPVIARRVASGLGMALMAAGLIYALYAIVVHFRAGVPPMLTMVAVLLGGMSMFMQAAAFSAIAPVGPARRSSRRREDEPAPATLAVAPNRIAHHRFAHQTLRHEVFANPAKLVAILQGPTGRMHLAELWDQQSRSLGLTPAENPADGLSTEMTQVGPYSAAIVTMPPPHRDGEAYFVGIVLRSYVRQDGAVIERQPVVLYYTLEAGSGANGAGSAAPAVFCEWQAGDHIRFADAVPPQFGAFRDAMWQKVQARQAMEDQLAAQPR